MNQQEQSVQTLKRLKRDIDRTTETLKIRWDIKGAYENFGQREVQRLKDKYVGRLPYLYEFSIRGEILKFERWCWGYTGS